MEKLRINLLSCSEDERWQEKELNPFGSTAKVRWFVHYEVRLFDSYSKELLEKSAWQRFKTRHSELLNAEHNPDGALGYIFGFTVCSPAFKEKPTEDYTEYISRALVQNTFDEVAAVEYLRNKLDSVGEKTTQELGPIFQSFLETDEWVSGSPYNQHTV